MLKSLLKAKIHRVTVTACELDYEGSCAIDGVLLDKSGICEYEHIHIYNINNGNRFTTYTIRAEDNSGIISVNGAAAHKVNVGDVLIIATYAQYDEKDIYTPIFCYVDEFNRITNIKSKIG